MKIQINYDLMDKIKESKTGISLVRNVRKSLLSSGIVFGVDFPIILMNENKLKMLMNIILICGWTSFVNIGIIDNLFGNKKINKYLSQTVDKVNFVNSLFIFVKMLYNMFTRYDLT